MATLSFACPQCHKVHDNVKPELAGSKVRCQCGHIFRLGPKSSKPVNSPTIQPPPVAKPVLARPIAVKPASASPASPAQPSAKANSDALADSDSFSGFEDSGVLDEILAGASPTSAADATSAADLKPSAPTEPVAAAPAKPVAETPKPNAAQSKTQGAELGLKPDEGEDPALGDSEPDFGDDLDVDELVSETVAKAIPADAGGGDEVDDLIRSVSDEAPAIAKPAPAKPAPAKAVGEQAKAKPEKSEAEKRDEVDSLISERPVIKDVSLDELIGTPVSEKPIEPIGDDDILEPIAEPLDVLEPIEEPVAQAPVVPTAPAAKPVAAKPVAAVPVAAKPVTPALVAQPVPASPVASQVPVAAPVQPVPVAPAPVPPVANSTNVAQGVPVATGLDPLADPSLPSVGGQGGAFDPLNPQGNPYLTGQNTVPGAQPTSNPYGGGTTLAPSRPSGGKRKKKKSGENFFQGEQAVTIAGIAVAVVGGLMVLGAIRGLIGAAASYQRLTSLGFSAEFQSDILGQIALYCAIRVGAGLVAVVGGLSMWQRQSYAFAWVAAVSMVIPFYGFSAYGLGSGSLGMLAGIFAIIVLCQPGTKDQFD